MTIFSTTLLRQLSIVTSKQTVREIITRLHPDAQISPELGFKDPTITKFFGFSDPFPGATIKEQLLTQLEWLLVEPDLDFTLVKPKKPARLEGKPFALDRVFYHRRLRCLVLVKLTLGKFKENYCKQMHLYCNYARALDVAGRKLSCRVDSVFEQRRGVGALRIGRVTQQNYGSGISCCLAGRTTTG